MYIYKWSRIRDADTVTVVGKDGTSSTSSNSTRLFLIPKKYFSAFIWRARSYNANEMSQISRNRPILQGNSQLVKPQRK